MTACSIVVEHKPEQSVRDFEENARIVQELTRTGRSSDPFSSAVRLAQVPMIITDPRQTDNPIVFANAAFSKATGFERHEIMGRNCRFLQGPEINRDDLAKLRTAIENRVPIELELLNYRRDGTTFWNRLLVSPVFNDGGDLTYFVASQYDVTLQRERLVHLERDRDDLESEVARRDAELIASEQRLRFALKASRMGSWSVDLTSERMIASEGCKENFGRAIPDPFTYADLLAAVHPDDRSKRDEAMSSAIADGTPLDVEYRFLTPAGEERWVQIRGQANHRADGTPLSLIGVSQDVTDRRRAEEHRMLLANELSHRVKNSLTMVQAIITQTLRKARSLDEAGATLEARIKAIAASNDLLINEHWQGASIRDLLDRTLAPFGITDGQQFDLSGPDIRLPPPITVALALSLHELATNASKYGALSRTGGLVRLAWEVVDETRPHLHFTWTETGGPAVERPDRIGFGTKLIERLLDRQLGGTAEIDYRAEGVAFKAMVPLADGADRN